MIKSIPFHPELLQKKATTNEVLLYGLIEVSSHSKGFCFASTSYMAEQLGISQGTIRNLLSKLSKRGWIRVEHSGNKRTKIRPLLPLFGKRKPVENLWKTNAKVVENPVENPVEKYGLRHRRMTLASS